MRPPPSKNGGGVGGGIVGEYTTHATLVGILHKPTPDYRSVLAALDAELRGGEEGGSIPGPDPPDIMRV